MSITTPLTAPHGPAATELAGGVPPAPQALRVVAAVLITTLAAMFAAPYLLVRGRLRRHRISRAIPVPRAHVPSLESRQAVA
jgi:hypothetical protein